MVMGMNGSTMRWLKRRLPAALIATVLVGVAACGGSPEVPDPHPTDEPSNSRQSSEPQVESHASAAAIVAALSTREQVATLIIASRPGTDAKTLSDFVSLTGISGFILMGDNVADSPEAMKDLTDHMRSGQHLPVFIAVDEEGGPVTRLPWDTLPSAGSLQASSPEEVRGVFEERAALLAQSGITVNFGIVADVPGGPDGFLADRAFGFDAQEVSARVAAAVEGERGIVQTTLKHFPGHGAAAGDSHVMIPSSDLSYDAWKTSHAIPFIDGIAAGAELVMVGHVRFPDIEAMPASLSPAWYRIAREDLGFEGLLITDDLGMLEQSGEPEFSDRARNIANALAAGADLALIVWGENADSLNSLIDEVAAIITEDGAADLIHDQAERVVQARLALVLNSAR